MQGVDAFAPLPRVKSNSEPYAIPSTSKLSSTPHNDSYPDGSPTSPIFLTAPTHPSPVGASTPVTQAVALVAQVSLASATIPTPALVVNPVALAAALVMVAGEPPDPS